jgi:flavin reductase (DIM6/NTAB) family NADH-FMN oxidoreductase RutF
MPASLATLPRHEGADADPSAFRAAMRSLAGAVSVVTTGTGEHRVGFTATSVSSLSVDPPRLIVCINRQSSSWNVLRDHGAFCVNLLADNQSDIADRFSGRLVANGADRYAEAHWQTLATGALGLSGAMAIIDCELEEAIERHTHFILIGAPRAITVRPDARPLLYWQSAYHTLETPS